MTFQYAVVSLGKAEPNAWSREERKEAERSLNLLGSEGWELVTVVGRKAFIKKAAG